MKYKRHNLDDFNRKNIFIVNYLFVEHRSKKIEYGFPKHHRTGWQTIPDWKDLQSQAQLTIKYVIMELIII